MDMTPLRMGEIIREKRRMRNLTQGDLANAAHVSVQAVSKWEIGQSFPDMALLPLISEVLDVPIGALFDLPETAQSPFPDDGKLRVVQYLGSRLVRADESGFGASIPLTVPEGTESSLNVWVDGCAEVAGNLRGSLHVEGDLACGGSIYTEGEGELHIGGDASAGGNISASAGLRVMGDLVAGGSVMIMHGLTCGGDIVGEVKATGDIHVGGNIDGEVEAGGGIYVGGDINGDASAQSGSVYCQGDIGSDVQAVDAPSGAE